MKWYEKLRQLRKDLGYTQERMAKFFRCSEAQYGRYERGKQATEQVRAIASFLEFARRNRVLRKYERYIDRENRRDKNRV